jgi:hypothetical protein
MNQMQLLAEIDKTQLFIRLFKAALQAAVLDRRYDPDQPRVPAGSPEGGQWASGGHRGESSSWMGLMLAARQQYDRDVFQCRMVGIEQCYAQAMVRWVACDKGHPIPPLNY